MLTKLDVKFPRKYGAANRIRVFAPCKAERYPEHAARDLPIVPSIHPPLTLLSFFSHTAPSAATMTNNVRDGPSLPQARNSHVYRHLHSHQQHAHGHLPRDSDGHSIRSPSPPPPPVSPPPPAAEEHAIVENRQEFVAPEPVVVVQTVSVLQIVDGSGAIIEVSTLFPDNPVTLPVAQIAETLGASLGGVAVSAAAGLSVAISPSLDLPTPTLDDGLPSSTDTADTVHVTNSSLSLSPPDEATLTSAPSTSITPQASLPAAANVTTSESRIPPPFSPSRWRQLVPTRGDGDGDGDGIKRNPGAGYSR